MLTAGNDSLAMGAHAGNDKFKLTLRGFVSVPSPKTLATVSGNSKQVSEASLMLGAIALVSWAHLPVPQMAIQLSLLRKMI